MFVAVNYHDTYSNFAIEIAYIFKSIAISISLPIAQAFSCICLMLLICIETQSLLYCVHAGSTPVCEDIGR